MSVLNKPVKPYTFVDGTGNLAYGSEVNANFDVLYNKVGDVIDVVNTTDYQTLVDTATLATDWASKTDGIVDTTDYSAKAYAIGGTGVTGVAGSAKEWAIRTDDTVDGTDYSAKHYALLAETAQGLAEDARDAAIAVQTELRKTFRTSNYSTFAEAVTAATGHTLTVDSDVAIAASTSVGVPMVVEYPGKFTIATGKTLTINGPFSCGLYQCFDGDGSVSGLLESRPEWFGAIADGVVDCTSFIQSAINSTTGSLVFSYGKYKYSSITIDKPIHICGKSNKNMCNISPAGGTAVGIKLGDLNYGTILYGTSLISPAISITANVRSSGLKISGFTFYQEHSNYASPTDYPYIISDENSASYWSGLTIEDCLFINANKGISLTHCERATINNINADFFRRGINIGAIRDVSYIDNVHIWNFAKSEAADIFRQSTDSDYAIYTDVVDGLFLTNIFIWDRLYGAYLSKTWTNARGIILDRVGYGLNIVDSREGFNNTISHVMINAENKVDTIAIPIHIHGTTIGQASCNLQDISIWTGGAAGYYAFNSGIKLDHASAVVSLDHINIKYAATDGILVSNASVVNLDSISFEGYFPNQVGYDLTTVGIRNNSTTAKLNVGIVSVAGSVLRYVFDGYSNYATFNKADNIISAFPYMSKGAGVTLAASYPSNYRVVTVTGISSASGFDGANIVCAAKTKSIPSGNYFCGAYYTCGTDLSSSITTDRRYVSMPRPGSEEIYIPVKSTAFSDVRCTIVRVFSNGGDMSSGPYARSFSGVLNMYGQFLVKSDYLSVGHSFGNDYRVGASPASAGTIYGVAGDRYSTMVPVVGQPKGWICTVSGTPGTWVSEGNL